MSDLTEEQLELSELLNGLTNAARNVRRKKGGKHVAVKAKTVDLLVRIARINEGELPSTLLHQYANELEAERAAHQETQAELEAARNEIDARRTRDELTVTGETWESLRQSFEVDSAIDAYDAARAKEDAE